MTRTFLGFAGDGDLHRHSGPQEHYSVQPVREAGPERRSADLDRRVHWRVRPDVTPGHRHRHQRDGGAAGGRRSDPGHPGGARRRDLHLHHLHGNLAARAQLSREPGAQGVLHPAGLHHHGRPDVPRLSRASVGGASFCALCLRLPLSTSPLVTLSRRLSAFLNKYCCNIVTLNSGHF